MAACTGLTQLSLAPCHPADTLAGLLHDRRLGRLALGLFAEPLDESPERDAAGRLVRAGQLGDSEHVGQGLLAPGAKNEGRVGARGREYSIDGLLDRAV